MSKKIFIHAVNVHQGGGRRLLEGLLGALDSDAYEYVLTLDERMPLSLKERPNITVRRIRPSIIQRFLAEAWLFRNARRGDRVLCFGNLPPLFRLQAFTSVFLQNRYLIDRVGLSGFTAWARLRITFERLWLRYAQLHANEYLVQTPSMLHLMNLVCHGKVPVTVLPFAVGQVSAKPAGDGGSTSATGFVYVASGEPHKNHRQLIEAWRILAEENIYPKLVLTVDKNAFPELCHWIEEKKKAHNLFVENLGSVNSEAMADIYAKTQALIYPSTFESLGLPLIEAEQAGVTILASELDYVRDVVSPVQTFNPGSAISISKAVKRFLGVSEPVMSVGSPATFMHHLSGRLN
jgi:glycosyltransferase involved in cell wall biosynthesis